MTKVAQGMGLDPANWSCILESRELGLESFCFPERRAKAFVRIAEKSGCDFFFVEGSREDQSAPSG